MMDLSSVIDASMTFAGAVAVVLMGASTHSSMSTTVSTHFEETGHRSASPDYSALRKAA